MLTEPAPTVNASLGTTLDDEALVAEDASWANFAPGLSIASSRHETQYSRLFRS